MLLIKIVLQDHAVVYFSEVPLEGLAVPRTKTYHSCGSNLKHSDPDVIRRVATVAGDLLDNLLDDPLTLCAGTLRTIAFTIHKTCEGGEKSK